MSDTRINFGDKIIVQEAKPRVFKRTETLEEYVARGGRVTKLATEPLEWSYMIRSTGKSGMKTRGVPTFNAEQEES